jgi:hypothetical protein
MEYSSSRGWFEMLVKHELPGSCRLNPAYFLCVVALAIGLLVPVQAQSSETLVYPLPKVYREKHTKKRVNGWTFYIEEGFSKEQRQEIEDFIPRLAGLLNRVVIGVLPSHARKELRNVSLAFRQTGKTEINTKMSYNHAAKFQGVPGASSVDTIVLPQSVSLYSSLSDNELKADLLHEFAHAYHLKFWHGLCFRRMDDPAWVPFKKAKFKGLYDSDFYGLRDQKEYFAELSVMYWLGPIKPRYLSSQRLKATDPEGHKMVKQMWSERRKRIPDNEVIDVISGKRVKVDRR